MILPLPPRQFAGQDNIAHWEDFLTESDIDKILALPDWHNSRPAEVGHDLGGRVDTAVRSSHVSWMNIDQNTTEIWGKIATVVAEVNRTWFHYDLTGFYEPAQLTLYQASQQGHYRWHCDNAVSDSGVPRKLSMSILLSDPKEFEGGELQVIKDSDQSCTLEQKKGRAWFFPSFMIHRVSPVTKGTRRSLVLWIGGPGFK